MDNLGDATTTTTAAAANNNNNNNNSINSDEFFDRISSPLISLIVGTGAAIPLDVALNRQQTHLLLRKPDALAVALPLFFSHHQHSSSSSSRATTDMIIKAELSLCASMFMSTLFKIPNGVIAGVIAGFLEDALATNQNNNDSRHRRRRRQQQQRPPPLRIKVIANGIAAATDCFLSYPIDVLLTRMAVQRWQPSSATITGKEILLKRYYRGILNTIWKVGLSHLYINFPFQLLSAVLHNVVCNVLESLFVDRNPNLVYPYQSPVPGVLCDLGAQMLLYPLAVIVANMRVLPALHPSLLPPPPSSSASPPTPSAPYDHHHRHHIRPRLRGFTAAIEIAKHIYAEEGPSGFYAGFGTMVLKQLLWLGATTVFLRVVRFTYRRRNAKKQNQSPTATATATATLY